jgi:ABC-2 type transport system ATP-binding protein
MIKARQLVKRFGDKTAVRWLDFSVTPGMVTGFLGPSDVGRSVPGASSPALSGERS